jgi:hypothetical protein
MDQLWAKLIFQVMKHQDQFFHQLLKDPNIDNKLAEDGIKKHLLEMKHMPEQEF